MDPARVAIILGMGLVTYVIRAVPQLFFAGRSFPEAFERYLRYLSYALIASIISTSLFLTGSRFEAEAAPYRGLALVAAVLVASWSQRPLLGMLVGTVVAVALPKLT